VRRRQWVSRNVERELLAQLSCDTRVGAALDRCCEEALKKAFTP
jgi:hypothetical protein